MTHLTMHKVSAHVRPTISNGVYERRTFEVMLDADQCDSKKIAEARRWLKKTGHTSRYITVSRATVADLTAAEAVRQVRAQYHLFWRRMATECMAWHLHRIPGTDQFSLFREDAVFDVPLPIVVRNVHAMTGERLAVLVSQIVQGA